MKTIHYFAFASLSIYLCFLNLPIAISQPLIQWQKSLGGTNKDIATSIQQTSDGGFIISGLSESNNGDVTGNHGGNDFWIVKLSSNSNIEWQKSLGGSGSDVAYSIQQTSDSGYIVAGYSSSNDGDVTGNHGFNDFWVVKLNTNGNIEWQKSIGGSSSDNASSIQQTNEGGYIVAGSSYSNDGDVTGNHGRNDFWVVKLSSNGNLEWQKLLGGANYDEANSIHQTLDGGYIVAGNSSSNDGDVTGNHGSIDYWIVKLSNNGNIEWQKSLGGILQEEAYSIQQTNDSGYIAVGNSFSNDGDVTGNHGKSDFWVVKFDKGGNTDWQKSLGGSLDDATHSIWKTLDGGFIIAGYSGSDDGDVSGNHGVDKISDYWVVKLNRTGFLEWQKLLGSFNSDYANSIQQTLDGGYIVAGSADFNGGDVSGNHGGDDFWIVKLSPARNYITGYVFNDNDNDCIFDSTENPESRFILQATPAQSYTTPDQNGFFQLSVDTGNYEVRVINLHPYKSLLCPLAGTYQISFNSYDTISAGNNFGTKMDKYCPILEVDISIHRWLRCAVNNFTVNFCNHGTLDENNPYIIITFHDSLLVQSASIPMINLSENSWRFDLDTLKVNECGRFTVNIKVACNTPLGTTLCATAMIYPDTLCENPDPQWDKSSVKVEANCVTDSLACFTIYNTGETGGGNMQGSSQWRLYANDTLILRNNFQLNGGDSLKLCFLAEGRTLRLEADQRPGHPGHSRPRATLEGCGVDSQGKQTLGFFMDAPEDDEDKNIEIFCTKVIGAYDPNDKNVKPEGSTVNHYINNKDELEYQINFQNTGNDTAFRVIVKDTLDIQTLDIATIQDGVSSHTNTFRIYDTGILEWKFSNILLPDSNVNETASHGFVKFKVQQKIGNPKGTLIENKAAIYFDYNVPVITNTTSNRVWNWDTTLMANIKKYVLPALTRQETLIIFPNPTGKYINLIINNPSQSRCSFRLFDVLGMKVKEYIELQNKENRIEMGNLSPGIYFYKLNNEKKEIIGSGKLIIQ